MTREMVQHVMKTRRSRSMCLIDLAVPRNVDPSCADLSEVFAYDVDDMDKVVQATQERGGAGMPRPSSRRR